MLAGTVTNSVTANNASAPVVGNGYVLWANTTGDVVKATYSGGLFGSPQPTSTGLGNLQKVMPLLGQGGLVYLLNTAGHLSVRNVSTLSQEVWGADIATTSGTEPTAQLALDVYRGAGGTKDCAKPLGVLYVLTKAGSTANLTAVLVDSKGLQADAPWPKYQRDNANRGNISTGVDLSSWTCP
jgi:hypothetical protein